ncbi:hypothetical protein CR513_29546, partial [Mucuna pruriens]
LLSSSEHQIIGINSYSLKVLTKTWSLNSQDNKNSLYTATLILNVIKKLVYISSRMHEAHPSSLRCPSRSPLSLYVQHPLVAATFLLFFAWPFAHTPQLSLLCRVEKQSASDCKTPNNYCICIEHLSNFWKGTSVYHEKPKHDIPRYQPRQKTQDQDAPHGTSPHIDSTVSSLLVLQYLDLDKGDHISIEMQSKILEPEKKELPDDRHGKTMNKLCRLQHSHLEC